MKFTSRNQFVSWVMSHLDINGKLYYLKFDKPFEIKPINNWLELNDGYVQLLDIGAEV